MLARNAHRLEPRSPVAVRTATRVIAGVLALAVLVLGVLIAIEVGLAALERDPLVLPHDEWYQKARQRPWDDSSVRWLSAGIAAAGLVLLVVQLAPRGRRTLPGSSSSSPIVHEVGRRSLQRGLARTAGSIDGVEHASARVASARATIRVRTPRRDPGDLSERIREAVVPRLHDLDLDREPAVQVHVRHREEQR